MMDVAIVGAGPAGSWAAYTLARGGARVTLIDPSHPREKPCGGGVTGRALALVGSALDIDRLPACAVRSARFTDSARDRSAVVDLSAEVDPSAGGTSVQRPLPCLVVANRTEFDGMLLSAARFAGAELVSARVIDVTAENGGYRIDTTTGPRRAAHVIGADGANSLVRRRLAHPFGRDRLSIATGYFAHGVTSDEIVIELVPDPPGYIWSFPRPTHLAIGICAQADAGVTAGVLRARALEWIGRTGIADATRLEPYSWPIPSLTARDFDSLAMSGRGWRLAGDAAGLVDPITREGIYFALLSGQWAAETLASGDRRSGTRYAEQVRDEIGSELARAAQFKAAFFRPRFTRLMIDALRRSGAIRHVMADLVAGLQPYAGLKWRLARTLEVGVAWRLMVSARSSRSGV
jgi:geranylgeranyl reductase family protein